MLGKPTSLAITTISFLTSVILLSPLIATTSLGLFSSNINGAFTGWIKLCVQAKLANGNNNNNNNSSVAGAITNPTFALANARASCTQLFQGYMNSNNQLTTQNQPTSSTTDPPTYPNQYQNPSSYPYLPQQQQSQAANTPTPQYPYQSPYQYPYQQPYPSTNQQQSPATNNAAVPPTSQYPYPYQQQPQQQNQSSSSVSNPVQYPYQQQQPQQQPQSSQSFTAGQPSVSTLIIVTHVNSTGGSNNTNQPFANFTQVVENAFTNPDGYTYIYHYMHGSETGVSLSLQPGSFAVYELSNNNNNVKTNNPTAGLSQSSYSITYSGDCRTVKSNVGGGTSYGYGTINLGETKTCTVTLSPHK
jgi:hypothetical protein